jgi:hypothetical protein
VEEQARLTRVVRDAAEAPPLSRITLDRVSRESRLATIAKVRGSVWPETGLTVEVVPAWSDYERRDALAHHATSFPGQMRTVRHYGRTAARVPGCTSRIAIRRRRGHADPGVAIVWVIRTALSEAASALTA